jgi:hypothetical protein
MMNEEELKEDEYIVCKNNFSSSMQGKNPINLYHNTNEECTPSTPPETNCIEEEVLAPSMQQCINPGKFIGKCQ